MIYWCLTCLLCYITRLCRNSCNTVVSFNFESFCIGIFLFLDLQWWFSTDCQSLQFYQILEDFSLFHCPLSTKSSMNNSISTDLYSFNKQRDILAKVSKGWTLCFVQLENLQSSSHSNSFCLFVWNKYFAEFHVMNFLPVPAFSR